VHTLQTLDTSEAAKLAAGSKPADSAADADDRPAKPASSSGADAKPAAATPSSRLGSLLQSLTGGNVTRIGGGGTTSLLGSFRGTTSNTPAPLTAHMRALAAADKVPEEQPRARKGGKAKQLSWAPDEELVATRLFLKADLPINARQDPAELPQGGAAPEGEPDADAAQGEGEGEEGFQQLARREHEVEAALLKGWHMAGDAADEEAGSPTGQSGPHPLLQAQRLLPWAAPPPAFLPDPSWQAGFGEESEQSSVLAGLVAAAPQQAPPGCEPLEAPYEPPVDNSACKAFPLLTPAELEAQAAAAAAAAALQPLPGQHAGLYAHAPLHAGAAAPVGVLDAQGYAAGGYYGAPLYRQHGDGVAGPGPLSQRGYARADEYGAGAAAAAGFGRVDRGGPPRKVCAFFNTPQGCRKGDNCEFLHEAGPGYMAGRGGGRGGPAAYGGGRYGGGRRW
jgi:hypothetical protein